MVQCPRCSGSAEFDPEHDGVMRCLSCWEVWALPKPRVCPGHRPTLMASLRMLEEFRDLRR